MQIDIIKYEQLIYKNQDYAFINIILHDINELNYQMLYEISKNRVVYFFNSIKRKYYHDFKVIDSIFNMYSKYMVSEDMSLDEIKSHLNILKNDLIIIACYRIIRQNNMNTKEYDVMKDVILGNLLKYKCF